MSAAPRKKPAPPDVSGLADDWQRLARMRQESGGATPAESEPAPRPPAAGRRPAMTRRSWYIDTGTAAAFAAAVDDIHHETRAPKHKVVSALLSAALDRADEVRRHLSDRE